MKWETVKLGEVAKVISGYAFKSEAFQESGGIPVIKIKNIQREKVDFSEVSYLPIEFLSVDTKFQVVKNDILISLTGSHITLPNSVVGRVAKYRFEFASLLNQRAGKITPKPHAEIDSEYLYQYLTLNDVRKEIALFGHGGANQCNISPGNVESIEIPLPPLPTQQKIASILSAYDDLIENNLKRIKLLEEAAQGLYREWFVRLRFPGWEGVQVVDGVPEGWERTIIKRIGQVVTGKTPSTTNVNYYGENVPFIKTPDMHKHIYMEVVEQYLSNEGADSQKNKYLPVNTVIIACIGALAGVVSLTSRVSQTNQQINAIIPDKGFYSFWLYFFCKSIRSKIHALGSSGATMVNVSKGKFENIEIVVPSEKLLMEFDRIVKPFFAQILLLQKQNNWLKEGRDMLLPRLMGGVLAV